MGRASAHQNERPGQSHMPPAQRPALKNVRKRIVDIFASVHFARDQPRAEFIGSAVLERFVQNAPESSAAVRVS